MSLALRAVIADDEPLSLRRLELGLARVAGVEVVGAAQSGEEARHMIGALRPDLVLLDIKMPGATGLELAEEFGRAERVGPAPEVIFVTAFGRHAVKAFDLDAVDYVLKPLDFDRLAEAVERARDRIEARDGAAKLAEMSAVLETLREGEEVNGANAGGDAYDRDLWVSDRHGRVRVPLDQVIWFEAEREYVRIHLRERSYLVRRALRDLALRLDPAQFLRLHRSALVNSARIARVTRRPGGGLSVELVNGVQAPVGRKYQRAVKARLGV
jgi:DNA-binding LytR/AlgR family response regulator